jgi:hypothetical protein
VKRPEKTFDGKKTWQTPGRRESNEASGLITIYIPKEKRQKKWTSTPTSMGIIDQIQNKIFVLKKYILIKKINYFNNN